MGESLPEESSLWLVANVRVRIAYYWITTNCSLDHSIWWKTCKMRKTCPMHWWKSRRRQQVSQSMRHWRNESFTQLLISIPLLLPSLKENESRGKWVHQERLLSIPLTPTFFWVFPGWSLFAGLDASMAKIMEFILHWKRAWNLKRGCLLLEVPRDSRLPAPSWGGGETTETVYRPNGVLKRRMIVMRCFPRCSSAASFNKFIATTLFSWISTGSPS